MNTIEEYYNRQYDEWGRLERHRIEYEITKKVLDEYIPALSDVLDIGGGPGRYSIYLAQKGNSVTLVDLSEKSVEQAISNAHEAGVHFQRCLHGNVLHIDKLLPDKQFDAVLCMGPMYHLLEEYERREALRQCFDLLKPGGILIVSFISAYAPFIDCLKSYPHEIKERKSRFLEYFINGVNDKADGFTDAYFIHPTNIESLISDFKLETQRIMAVEGLGALCEEKLNQLSIEDFQEWINLFYKIADNRVIWGACEHLLYVGRKAE
jgi:S-adenosylmethionine-dependent methyltransferase